MCLLNAELRLLYVDGYREPETPGATDVRQTAPPTVPITTLYPQGNYPIGKEEHYTVSLVVGWHSYICGCGYDVKACSN